MPDTVPVSIRQAILDAAAYLLCRRGYESTTLRAIGDRAGIKAGSIYHYFASKDAIMVAVLNEGVRLVHQAVHDGLAALADSAEPVQRIETAIRWHLRASLENSDYTSASIRAFGFLPEAVRAECLATRRAYERIWRALIAEAAAAGVVRAGLSEDVLRLMLLGAVNWAGEWYRPGRLGIDAIAHDFAHAVVC